MWDLPGPGPKPVSPALAGGFLTTVPPGKPRFRNLASRKKEREKKELDKEPTPGSGTQHPGTFMTQTKFTLEFGDKSSKGHWTFKTMFLDDEAEMFL